MGRPIQKKKNTDISLDPLLIQPCSDESTYKLFLGS